MERLWRDIRFAIRALTKSPGFAAVAVLSLALGIGANTTIFTLINAVFLSSLQVEDSSELVAVYTVDANVTGGFGGLLQVSRPNFLDFREKNEVFTDMAAFTFPLPASMTAATAPEQVTVEMVTGNYFGLLGVRPIQGRAFHADEDTVPGGHPVAVISYGLWQRSFGGDPSVVGRDVSLNGLPFTIVGVTAEGFKGVNALFSPDMWVPSMMYATVLPTQFRDWFDNRRALLYTVAARLEPGVGMGQAEANLKTLASALEREYPEPNKGRAVTLRPLTEATVFPGIRDALVLGSAVLMVIVGLVLLIACSNVANLLLARATARRQEIAVRIALGAGRRRLIRQLLTESVILAIAAGAVGLLIAVVARDLIWSLRPPFLAQNFVQFDLDRQVLAFTVAISVLTGVVFGILPAIQASKANVVDALKEESRGAGRSRRRITVGNVLVVSQVALSLVALVAAGLFLRSLQRANEINPGFETETLAAVGVIPGQAGYDAPRARTFFEQVKARALAMPGVQAVAWTSAVPLTGNFMRTFVPEGKDPLADDARSFAINITVSTGYFDTMRIPIVRGRDFTNADREGAPRVAIINETFAARIWPDQDPIGRRFTFYGDDTPHEVVGLARDVKYNTLGEDPQVAAYVPLEQNFTETTALLVRTEADPAAALGMVQREIRAMDRNVPIVFPFTMSQIVDQSLWGARLAAILLAVFGGLALALASIGLYGVMAYSVSQRTHEIGLRMALGAAQPDVMRLVLTQGLRLVGIGTLVGLAAALAVSRLVSTLLFGVSPTDLVTFIGVSILLGLVALVASYVPAFRASRVDPMIALRS